MKINYRTFKKGGFTLIELMVVIAIIGILTAIVSSNFGASKAKSRDAKRVSDLAQIQLTLELFFDRCNNYPATLSLTSGSKITTPAETCPTDPATSQPLKLGYFISTLPKENATTDYDYYVNTSGTDYVVGTKFESNNAALTDAIPTFPTSLGATNNKFPDNNDCTHPTNGPYYYCVVPK